MIDVAGLKRANLQPGFFCLNIALSIFRIFALQIMHYQYFKLSLDKRHFEKVKLK